MREHGPQRHGTAPQLAGPPNVEGHPQVTVTSPTVAATAPALTPEVRSVSFRGIRRGIAPVLVSVAIGSTAGTAFTVVAPQAAFADSTYSMEAQFIAKVNAARQANGQAPYSVAGDLTSIARGHSANMARQQSLYHNPSLTTQVQNWQAVGENVGEGPDVNDIATAFMQSPEHRANILDHDFTQIGVGVSVDKNGIVWVTEDFRKPMYASSSSSSSGSSSHQSSSSTSHYTPTVSNAVAPVASVPQPRISPRAMLLQKLHQLKQSGHAPKRTDPVAQSFVYVANLSRLAA